MSKLALSLLGPVRVELDGRLLTSFRSSKVKALLFYLAIENEQPVGREFLMSLLWPDTLRESAQTNLRQALYQLHKEIPALPATHGSGLVPLLLAERQTVQVHPEAAVACDVQQFRSLLAGGPGQWPQAAGLYRGDFLSDFCLSDSVPFEEWTAVQRANLQRQALELLEALADQALTGGDYVLAEFYARRQLALDDLREVAHRQLMSALAQSGRRIEALTHCQEFVTHLWQELALQPEATTQALVAQIRAGASSAARPVVAPVVPDNLPVALTPFIGREAEMAAMAAQFEEETSRLLTLHGPGGVGKTRLALEFARRNRAKYAQGVCFVPLAGLASAANLAPTIAAALGLSLSPQPEPRQQLLRFLQPRQLLLLLDNFEHLREGANLLVDILQAAPQVRILVTSRERLQLAAENLFLVPGLRTAAEAGESAAESEAVQMFVAYARRARHDYRLDGEDRPAVTGICRLVEGMPLAIELAAAWVRAIPPVVILEQIAAGSSVLETAGVDVPPRLRSVRASFNYSWGLLDKEEQQALMCLSACRGGCSGAAATACGAATPQILAALVDKSMLAYDPASDRYTLHELVRQLAEERLQAGGQAATVYHRHAGHFCALAREAWSQVETDQLYDVYYQVIGPELDNCRAAQQRSSAAGEVEDALQLAVALSEYLANHGMAEEALRLLEEALAVGDERCAPATRAAAYLQVADIWLDHRAGREKPIEFAEKGLALYRALADQVGVARALFTCGCMFFAYDFDRSRDYLTQAIEAWERAGKGPLSGLGTLAVLEIFAGNFGAACSLNAQWRAFCEKQGLKGGVASADTSMAYICYYQERLEEAQALAEKSLETQRALGNRCNREIEILARISLKQRRLDRAWALLREWLQMTVNDSYFSQAMFCLQQVAEWFYHTGHPQRAAFWIGSHDQAREWFVQPVEPVRLPHYQWLVAAIRDALGEEAYTGRLAKRVRRAG